MSKLPKRHFWEWFKRNKDEFAGLNKKSKKEKEYWLRELNTHLRAYFKFLSYSLKVEDEGECSLTITVRGDESRFRRVDALVATAPEIPGWKIFALNEPMPIWFGLENQIMETGIDPREFYFSVEENDFGLIDIVVYAILYNEEEGYEYFLMAQAAIYNLLGERFFGMNVRHVEVGNLSEVDSTEVRKLEELPAYIESMKSWAMLVDENGRLMENESYQ